MPELILLHQKYQNMGFHLIVVSIDSNRKAVEDYFQNYSTSALILWDKEHQVKKQYEVTGIPRTFVIDSQRKIQLDIIGSDIDALKEHLNQVFGRKQT